MRLAIEHDTVYRYDAPVARSTQYLRLTPRASSRVKIIQWQLSLPAPASQGFDAYGNVLHVLTLDTPHTEIHLRAHGIVETDDAPPAPEADDSLPPELFQRGSALTESDAALSAFAETFATAVRSDRLAGLMALMHALADRLPYTPGQTDVATSAAQAFAHGQGVCQDHAHVFVACVRHLGIPARYVSGYLATDAEHVASHAWAEAWMGAGWLGFDVSNRCLAGNHHVKLAVGMDYLDACPVRGVRMGGGLEAMQTVARVGIADQ